MSNADDGFLSRWSRRKSQARDGTHAPEPVDEVTPSTAVDPVPPSAPVATPTATQATEPTPDPAPTLDDVARLTRDSHYGRFVRPDVDPAVKNAALKKLFADPQFNVMDGLDTYIDDYGKPDPLPASMLRQMAQARFLGLFDDEKSEPDNPPPSVASAADLVASDPEAPVPESLPHENTDLRLQPDDADRRAGVEPGPGPDAGREH